MSQDEPFFELDGDVALPTEAEAWAAAYRQASALQVLQRLIDAGMEVEFYRNPAAVHMPNKAVTASAFLAVRVGSGPETEMQNRGRGEGPTVADALFALNEWVRWK